MAPFRRRASRAPDRRTPEKLSEIDQAAANAFEGEIREFVRRDVSFLRRPRSENGDAVAADPVTDNLNSLIRRVSGASLEEIERVITELQSIRDMLRSEGERARFFERQLHADARGVIM